MEDQRRHRVDIGENVYRELDAEARWLGISPGALATMLIREGLARPLGRSPLAAQIVAEGSPSPTLAELQRRAGKHLAAAGQEDVDIDGSLHNYDLR